MFKFKQYNNANNANFVYMWNILSIFGGLLQSLDDVTFGLSITLALFVPIPIMSFVPIDT